MALIKVEIKRIKFIKDAKDIRRETLGKIIKKDTELVCTGKALELFLKSGVAEVVDHKDKESATIENKKDK